jgi:hypothetical protein
MVSWCAPTFYQLSCVLWIRLTAEMLHPCRIHSELFCTVQLVCYAAYDVDILRATCLQLVPQPGVCGGHLHILRRHEYRCGWNSWPLQRDSADILGSAGVQLRVLDTSAVWLGALPKASIAEVRSSNWASHSHAQLECSQFGSAAWRLLHRAVVVFKDSFLPSGVLCSGPGLQCVVAWCVEAIACLGANCSAMEVSFLYNVGRVLYSL